MKTDAELKSDVSEELAWDPAINATHVGVAVDRGVVTLTGHVETFAEKHAIERAVQRVKGVRLVAVELDVKLAPDHRRSDTEIAHAVESALKWNAVVGPSPLQVKVEKGWVTLGGQVRWGYQRAAAEKAVRHLLGVTGVSNLVEIRPATSVAQVASQIGKALARQAEREARHVNVSVNGSEVTLQGHVHSWAEAAAAAGAAWSAPGVTRVVNQLIVDG
jgi:osmotically-inducible protein OsmY